MIIEAYTLTAKRTLYGKQIRSKYESHQIHEKRKNMTTLEPRWGGICGTLTSVEKDNFLLIYEDNQ